MPVEAFIRTGELSHLLKPLTDQSKTAFHTVAPMSVSSRRGSILERSPKFNQTDASVLTHYLEVASWFHVVLRSRD
jgi:hypothetical protein